MIYRDRDSLSRQSPIAPALPLSVVCGSLSSAGTHACRARGCTCWCVPPCALVCARWAVLSRHNFCVATQVLPALTTSCHDTDHGCDTRSTGFCRNRENLCRDLSHPVPAINLVATLRFYRDTGPSNLCRDREFSIATEELWVICHDKNFLSQQAFRLVNPASTRSHAESWSVAHTRACCPHFYAHFSPVACATVRAAAAPLSGEMGGTQSQHIEENGQLPTLVSLHF